MKDILYGLRVGFAAALAAIGLWATLSPLLLAALAVKLWRDGAFEYLRNHGELSHRTLMLLAVALAGTLVFWVVMTVFCYRRRQ